MLMSSPQEGQTALALIFLTRKEEALSILLMLTPCMGVHDIRLPQCLQREAFWMLCMRLAEVSSGAKSGLTREAQERISICRWRCTR